jgi:flagellar protein FlaJ
MVNPLWLLPSVVVVVAVGAWLLAKVDTRSRRIVARIGRVVFGRFVSEDTERERVIESAYIDSSYRNYASVTLLYTTLAVVAGAIAGGYIVAGVLTVFESFVRLLSQLPDTISLTIGARRDYQFVIAESDWWALVLGGGVAIGLLSGLLAYVFRWKLPVSNAEVRRRSIEEGLPRTAAFMFALSRGGMEFPKIVRTLAHNREVYGETANEMSITVREMDLFGRDMITALRRMTRRTPSDQFKTFSENLASVLQSGSSLPNFLRDQYERFREDAEERQENVLELLATIAEAYVTILVAGILFLITILLVFGLTTTDTLLFLKLIGYILIPVANAGFAVYLAQKLETLGLGQSGTTDILDRHDVETPLRPSPETDTRRPDGGVAQGQANETALTWYDRISSAKAALRDPFRTLIWKPSTVLYVTVPVAVIALLVRFPQATRGTGINLRVLDDIVIQSMLFVLVTFAIVRLLYKRRVSRIEAATPELLERLASLNEAGMSVVDGVDRVRGSDLGVLTPEVERIWRDIQYGSNVADALVRFGRRVRTTAITRVVVLLTNAMRASGQMGGVLRIAANQARADLRLKRQRRNQMLTYLVVIYVAFFVFLVIILAVNEVLVPTLPESVPQPTSGNANRLGVNVDQFARLGQVDKAAYTLVFFHTALIHAVCTGFIGGQLGEGTLKDGAKHAAIMLTIAYVVFLLFSSPVASVAAGGATSTGDALHVESASLSDGGYLVVYDDSANSTILGQTSYLEAGTHKDVTIPLQRPVESNRTVTVVAHRETGDNRIFDYPGPPHRPGSGQPDRPYSGLAEDSSPGVETAVQYVGNSSSR